MQYTMAGLKQTVLVLATLAAIVGMSSAATITVGDSTGWTIPPTPSFYGTWAAKQNVKVGDVLVFNFKGTHTVAEVSKSAYDSCNTANPISPVKTTSPASVTVSSPGTHYFICTIAGHCSLGQKLAITVTSPSSSSAPAPAPKAATAPAPSTATAPSGAAPATGGAATPAASPSGGATTPSATPSGGATTGAPSATTPAASSPGGATADSPSGNFAASTTVGLLSLVSVAAAAVLF